MVLNIKIVRVDSDYCDYLRNYDSKVSYNMNEKESNNNIRGSLSTSSGNNN